MTLEKLNAIFEACAPEGWDYFAFKYAGKYNTKNEVRDVMILLYPNNYPLLRFDKVKLDIKFRLGKVVPVKTTDDKTEGQPYAEIISELEDEARLIIAKLNTHSDFLQTDEAYISHLSADEGSSVNHQFWVEVSTKATVWYCDYAPVGSFLTEGLNGFFVSETKVERLKFSQLEAAVAFDGSEQFPILQGGENKLANIADIISGDNLWVADNGELIPKDGRKVNTEHLTGIVGGTPFHL